MRQNPGQTHLLPSTTLTSTFLCFTALYHVPLLLLALTLKVVWGLFPNKNNVEERAVSSITTGRIWADVWAYCTQKSKMLIVQFTKGNACFWLIRTHWKILSWMSYQAFTKLSISSVSILYSIFCSKVVWHLPKVSCYRLQYAAILIM